MKSLEEIFANTRVDSSTGCRIWLGYTDVYGYGQVYWQGEPHRVPRVVWELTTGSSPGALDVLHTCDNPPCCEFTHLFLGTALDNMRDCVAKGRYPQRRGEQNGRHKLTEEQVAEIRSLLSRGLFPKELATRYGVTQMTISQIKLRRTWAGG